jgi:hypothetical protein
VTEPEIRITRGAPAPDEEAAVRAAVLKLWREDQAKAARDAAPDPWTLAARVEGARGGLAAVRARGGASAWRLSARLGAEPVSHVSIGRGDAK